MSLFRKIWFVVYFIFSFRLELLHSQYTVNDPKYDEVMEQSTETLQAFIETHEDVEFIIHPDREMIYTDNYVFAEPVTEDYRIGILLDPVFLLCSYVSLLIFCFSVDHFLMTVA